MADGLRSRAAQRALRLVLVAIAAALLTLALRGYLDPALVIDLANTQLCSARDSRSPDSNDWIRTLRFDPTLAGPTLAA